MSVCSNAQTRLDAFQKRSGAGISNWLTQTATDFQLKQSTTQILVDGVLYRYWKGGYDRVGFMYMLKLTA